MKFLYPDGIFSNIFLIEAPGQAKSTGDLCSCGWNFGNFGEVNGCKIDTPPPAGYKCVCSLVTFVACNGRGLKCESEEELGCNGCKEKECCVGNCNGYE